MMKAVGVLVVTLAAFSMAQQVSVEEMIAQFEQQVPADIAAKIEAAKAEAMAAGQQIQDQAMVVEQVSVSGDTTGLGAKIEELKAMIEKVKAVAEAKKAEILASLPDEIKADVAELEQQISQRIEEKKAELLETLNANMADLPAEVKEMVEKALANQ